MKKMEYEIVKLEPVTIAGIALRTENTAAGFENIQAHWGRFFKETILEKVPAKKEEAIYEAYFDYESDARGPYTLLLGARVEDGAAVGDGMTVHTLPATSYAKFLINDPNGVRAAWEEIWGRSDLDRSYSGDFEIFRKEAVELYVAVRSE